MDEINIRVLQVSPLTVCCFPYDPCLVERVLLVPFSILLPWQNCQHVFSTPCCASAPVNPAHSPVMPCCWTQPLAGSAAPCRSPDTIQWHQTRISGAAATPLNSLLHATLCFCQEGLFADHCPHYEDNPSILLCRADSGGEATWILLVPPQILVSGLETNSSWVFPASPE